MSERSEAKSRFSIGWGTERNVPAPPRRVALWGGSFGPHAPRAALVHRVRGHGCGGGIREGRNLLRPRGKVLGASDDLGL